MATDNVLVLGLRKPKVPSLAAQGYVKALIARLTTAARTYVPITKPAVLRDHLPFKSVSFEIKDESLVSTALLREFHEELRATFLDSNASPTHVRLKGTAHTAWFRTLFHALPNCSTLDLSYAYPLLASQLTVISRLSKLRKLVLDVLRVSMHQVLPRDPDVTVSSRPSTHNFEPDQLTTALAALTELDTLCLLRFKPADYSAEQTSRLLTALAPSVQEVYFVMQTFEASSIKSVVATLPQWRHSVYMDTSGVYVEIVQKAT